MNYRSQICALTASGITRVTFVVCSGHSNLHEVHSHCMFLTSGSAFGILAIVIMPDQTLASQFLTSGSTFDILVDSSQAPSLLAWFVTDMSSTAFIEPKTVMEFIRDLLNKDLSRGLTDSDRNKVWDLSLLYFGPPILLCIQHVFHGRVKWDGMPTEFYLW